MKFRQIALFALLTAAQNEGAVSRDRAESVDSSPLFELNKRYVSPTPYSVRIKWHCTCDTVQDVSFVVVASLCFVKT